jgi:hypothetical protein
MPLDGRDGIELVIPRRIPELFGEAQTHNLTSLTRRMFLNCSFESAHAPLGSIARFL